MKGGASDNRAVFGESVRDDQLNNNKGYQDTSSKVLRSQTINTSSKTLILFGYGCSNGAGVAPGAFTPTNVSVIDNLNLYDGAIYAASNPLLSAGVAPVGNCNIMLPLADALINNNKFDRVILVPCCIGGTNTFHWAADGVLYNKISAGMYLLNRLGITPSTTGCTFAIQHLHGENDSAFTQLDYTTNVASNTLKVKSSGFSGRIFVNKQSLLNNVTSATVRAAQTALVDNVNYFAGGDLDTLLGVTYRQTDNTHFNLTGQSAAATLMYNAMHASGAPF